MGFFRSASINISPTSHIHDNNSSKVRQVIGRNATFSHPTPSRLPKSNILKNIAKNSENAKAPLLNKANEKKKVYF
jgi:hypothetical protein